MRKKSVWSLLVLAGAVALPARAQCLFGGSDADGGVVGTESCTYPVLSAWSYVIETREDTYVEADCWRTCSRPLVQESDMVDAVNCFSLCMKGKYPGTPENPPACGDRLKPGPPFQWRASVEAYGVHLESSTDTHFVCSGGYPVYFRRTRRSVCPAGYFPRGYVTHRNYPQRCVRPISSCSIPRTRVGNPIDVLTSEKSYSFVDIPDTGSGLSFGLNYSSYGTYRSMGLGPAESFTPGADFWNHTFASRVVPEVGSTNLFASVVSPSGRVRHFGFDSREVLNTGVCGTTLAPAGTGFLLRDPNGVLERFDAQFRLVERSTLSGQRVQLSYSTGQTPSSLAPRPGLLLAATAGARAISFGWSEAGTLSSATDPDGNVVRYQFDGFGNLSTVTLPEMDGGTSQRRYVYEQPTVYNFFDGERLLTGVLDEEGRRFARYTYQSGGTTTSTLKVTTEHGAGVQKYISQNYGSYAQVHNPSGTYSYFYLTKIGGIDRVTQLYDQGGSGYAWAMTKYEYNAAGDITAETDGRGFKRCYELDSSERHLVVATVSGLAPNTSCAALAVSSPPAQARVDRVEWHPVWNLETRRSEPNKRTTWVYHGQPDPLAGGVASCAPSTALLLDGSPITVLCKKVEEATLDPSGALGFSAPLDFTTPPRTEQWTYDDSGRVLTFDGPRADVNDLTVYSYYTDTTATHTAGDLYTTRDALGNVITSTRYTKSGEVLEQVDANGVVTTMTYDPRHRLTSRTVGGLTTTYTYDRSGLLKRETRPDGTWVDREYDEAHQLMATVDQRGTRVEFTRNAWGHVTAERTRDVTGVVRREVLHEYDPVGNRSRTTGEEVVR